MQHSGHLNCSSQNSRNTQTYCLIKLLALIKTTDSKNKGRKKVLKPTEEGGWTDGVVLGCHLWHIAYSFLPLCGFRQEVDD